MSLSFNRLRDEIMDEFSKEELFDVLLSQQAVPFDVEHREYHCLKALRKHLILQRSLSKFPERNNL